METDAFVQRKVNVLWIMDSSRPLTTEARVKV
jgi:hypothetical protein